MLLFNSVVLLLVIPAVVLAQDGAPVDYSERMASGEPEAGQSPINTTTSNSTMGYTATTKAATVIYDTPQPGPNFCISAPGSTTENRKPTSGDLSSGLEVKKREEDVRMEPYGEAWVAHVLQIWAVSTLPTIIFCVWRLIVRIRDPERQRPMPKQSHLLK